MKVACPVWEGLQEDRVVRATYGVLILLHPVPTAELVLHQLALLDEMEANFEQIAVTGVNVGAALAEVQARRADCLKILQSCEIQN
jgi:hypothetical protein